MRVWLGEEWCDNGPRGKGGLGEGGLPRVWHRLTPSVSPPEHVFMSCTNAVPYFH